MKKKDAKKFGKRLVACSAWQWLPGMLKLDGARVLLHSPSAPPGDLPDIRDFATQGCVQALILEEGGIIDERGPEAYLIEECELWVRSLEELSAHLDGLRGPLVSVLHKQDKVKVSGCPVPNWTLDSRAMTLLLTTSMEVGDILDAVLDRRVYRLRAERHIPANTPIPLEP